MVPAPRHGHIVLPFFACFDGGVFDLAHRLQQRCFALFGRDFAVGLEQFPEVADQVGIGEQARPVRSFGRTFVASLIRRDFSRRSFPPQGSA